jgi:hypothetical protein
MGKQPITAVDGWEASSRILDGTTRMSQRHSLFLVERARVLLSPGVDPYDVFGERWDAQAKAAASWALVANDADECHLMLTMANDVVGYLEVMGATEGKQPYRWARPDGDVLLTTFEGLPCVWSTKSEGFVWMTIGQVQQVYHAISTNTL